MSQSVQVLRIHNPACTTPQSFTHHGQALQPFLLFFLFFNFLKVISLRITTGKNCMVNRFLPRLRAWGEIQNISLPVFQWEYYSSWHTAWIHQEGKPGCSPTSPICLAPCSGFGLFIGRALVLLCVQNCFNGKLKEIRKKLLVRCHFKPVQWQNTVTEHIVCVNAIDF